MGVDCTPSISKAGLYLLVPMFGPSWAKGQRLPEEFFSQRCPQWTSTSNQSDTNAPRGCTASSGWLSLGNSR